MHLSRQICTSWLLTTTVVRCCYLCAFLLLLFTKTTATKLFAAILPSAACTVQEMELLSIRPVLQPFLQKWSWLDGLASKPTTAKPPTPRGSHILRERRELQSLESQVLGDVVRALKNATDVPDEFVLKAAKYNICEIALHRSEGIPCICF